MKLQYTFLLGALLSSSMAMASPQRTEPGQKHDMKNMERYQEIKQDAIIHHQEMSKSRKAFHQTMEEKNDRFAEDMKKKYPEAASKIQERQDQHRAHRGEMEQEHMKRMKEHKGMPSMDAESRK